MGLGISKADFSWRSPKHHGFFGSSDTFASIVWNGVPISLRAGPFRNAANTL
jgi:hypothetical protein